MLIEKKFQKFIQDKCLELVIKVADESVGDNTQPRGDFELYQANHKYQIG